MTEAPAIVESPTPQASAPGAPAPTAPLAAPPSPPPAAHTPAPTPAPAAPDLGKGPAPPIDSNAPTPAPGKTVADLAKAPVVDPNAPKAPAPAAFPDDWRKQIAGEDADALKRLERFASPADVWKSFKAMEQRMSSGELKKALPTNATPEEVAAFRKDNGIPDKPDGYDTNLGNGVVWGEADKPFLDSFKARAHELNMPPGQMKDMLNWYQENQDAAKAIRDEADQRFQVQAEDAMRAAYGNDFRRNLNALGAFFTDAPAGLWDRVMTSRDEHGKIMGNDPEFLQFMIGRALTTNPLATLVPGGDNGSMVKSARQEFDGLSKLMGDKESEYWRGPSASANQAKWRDLREALVKMGEKV